MNNNNQFSFLDLITIISFIIGLWALELAMQNLVENEEQSLTQQELLHKLNQHLHIQDNVLNEQTEKYLKEINDKLNKMPINKQDEKTV